MRCCSACRNPISPVGRPVTEHKEPAKNLSIHRQGSSGGGQGNASRIEPRCHRKQMKLLLVVQEQGQLLFPLARSVLIRTGMLVNIQAEQP